MLFIRSLIEDFEIETKLVKETHVDITEGSVLIWLYAEKDYFDSFEEYVKDDWKVIYKNDKCRIMIAEDNA
jgi:hypothetical protein